MLFGSSCCGAYFWRQVESKLAQLAQIGGRLVKEHEPKTDTETGGGGYSSILPSLLTLSGDKMSMNT